MTQLQPALDELYRDVILDHYRRPRNRGRLASRTGHAEGANPVCGDEIELDVAVRDGRIEEVAFGGVGCSISQASASLMTERIRGMTVSQARALRADFRRMLLDGEAPSEALGDLEAMEGVHRFPVRVKCALLAWNVLDQAIGADE